MYLNQAKSHSYRILDTVILQMIDNSPKDIFKGINLFLMEYCILKSFLILIIIVVVVVTFAIITTYYFVRHIGNLIFSRTGINMCRAVKFFKVSLDKHKELTLGAIQYSNGNISSFWYLLFQILSNAFLG